MKQIGIEIAIESEALITVMPNFEAIFADTVRSFESKVGAGHARDSYAFADWITRKSVMKESGGQGLAAV